MINNCNAENQMSQIIKRLEKVFKA
jgi:hypothetical protein